jgi:hypothetical protein
MSLSSRVKHSLTSKVATSCLHTPLSLRKGMRARLALVALCLILGDFAARSQGAVITTDSQQLIYDRSPKLRIQSELGGDEHQIHLTFQPQLVEDKDYTLTKKGDALVLKLLEGRKYVPRALYRCFACIDAAHRILNVIDGQF